MHLQFSCISSHIVPSLVGCCSARTGADAHPEKNNSPLQSYKHQYKNYKDVVDCCGSKLCRGHKVARLTQNGTRRRHIGPAVRLLGTFSCSNTASWTHRQDCHDVDVLMSKLGKNEEQNKRLIQFSIFKTTFEIPISVYRFYYGSMFILFCLLRLGKCCTSLARSSGPAAEQVPALPGQSQSTRSKWVSSVWPVLATGGVYAEVVTDKAGCALKTRCKAIRHGRVR